MNDHPADPDILSGAAWKELCARLEKASELVLGADVPASPISRAEGFRYLTRFLEAGIRSCVSHANPDYPVFGRMIEYTMTWGLDAPDCLYLYAPVRGGTSYTISGQRGTANHIDLQVNAGHYANGDVGSLETISSMSGFDLTCDSGGAFELSLAHEKPVGAANWLALREDAEFVLIRQYFDDWDRERPADLLIERDDAVYPMPATEAHRVGDDLRRLCTWIERGGALWEQMSRGFLSMPENSLVVHLPENADKRTGMAGQAYGIGNFRCAEDEAVIVEFTPPPCHHWSFSLANYYWESIDYATRQTSLNGHQSCLDPDGVFRAVISHDDPGIANWLDTGGNTQGSIALRFLLADHAPKPILTAVKRAEVDGALPNAQRISPSDRARVLTARRRAVMRRYRV